MRRDMKRAILCAVIGYLIAVGFACGMLRTAQKTRQTLYGGTPVLAQVTKKLPDTEQSGSYEFCFGGGEWQLSMPLAGGSPDADGFPPCTAFWLLRLRNLSVRAADQTAEWIAGAAK